MSVARDTLIDEIAVEMAVEGDLSVSLTADELRTAWLALEEQGFGAKQIAQTLGVRQRTVVRWRTGTPVIKRRPALVGRAQRKDPMTTTMEDIDHDAINRAITGDRGPALTAAELRAAWKRLEDEDLSAEEIADTLGVPYNRVINWRTGGEVVTGRPGTEKPNAVLTPLGPRPVGFVEPKATNAVAPKANPVTPETPSVTPKAEPVSQADDIATLIQQGLASDLLSIRKLAIKAQDTINKLRDEIAEDAAKAEARAEVARLEAELAAAKARLRGDRPAPSERKTTTERPATGISFADVRRWCGDNSIPCNTAGHPGSDVVKAYKEAHGL